MTLLEYMISGNAFEHMFDEILGLDFGSCIVEDSFDICQSKVEAVFAFMLLILVSGKMFANNLFATQIFVDSACEHNFYNDIRWTFRRKSRQILFRLEFQQQRLRYTFGMNFDEHIFDTGPIGFKISARVLAITFPTSSTNL